MNAASMLPSVGRTPMGPVKISVKEAIRRASGKPTKLAVTYSHWSSEHTPKRGKKLRTPWKHNLTTDTASGYTNRRDWQSKAMADFGTTAFATNAAAATATGASTLTNSGATFPTAGQGLAGKLVAVGPNASGTGSVVFGVILSNTGTVLTVDQWYDPTSTTGAAGSTPNATGKYVILPGQAPAPWLAVTADATGPSSADTALASELASNGFSRAIGTYAHTAAATTYTLTHLWTASGTQTINKEGVLGAASGGVFPFESAEPSPPTLVSGDTLTNTVTVTIN